MLGFNPLLTQLSTHFPSMFTKSYFIAIAKVVALLDSAKDRKFIARELCTIFAESNPHFNRSRFLSTCNAENEPLRRIGASLSPESAPE
jgi:hypothetical protein